MRTGDKNDLVQQSFEAGQSPNSCLGVLAFSNAPLETETWVLAV